MAQLLTSNINGSLNVTANIANVGNLLVTQNTFTGNLSVTTLANVVTLNVSANIANVGNLLVTQNTFTGNLKVTTLANVVTLNVSANTINVGTATSLGVNGFSRLTNGLLFQWGSLNVSSTTGLITFPSAFTTLYSITAIASNSTFSNTHDTQVINTSATAANVRTGNATNTQVYWTAIGI